MDVTVFGLVVGQDDVFKLGKALPLMVIDQDENFVWS